MTSAGIPKFGRQAFFQNRCEAVGLADRCQARKQQVYFDDLAVSGGSEAYPMVLNGQFRANCIQFVPNFPASFRIRIIHQSDCRTPDQVAS